MNLDPLTAAAEFILHALFRASWQGGIALLAAWMICRAIPKLPPAVKPWLWRLAMLKMFVALFSFSPLTLDLLPPSPAAQPFPVSLAPTPSVAPLSATALNETQRPLNQLSRTATSARSDLPFIAESTPAVHLEAAASPVPAPHTRSNLPPQRSLAWPILIVIFWSAGVLFCLAMIFRQFFKARTLRKTAAIPPEPLLIQELAAFCRQVRLRRIPRLVLSQTATTPVLLGLIRPTIILPASLATSWPREKLRMILAHELAHLIRHDLLWTWLAALLHALFFFHPLAWLARRETLLAQESACDELALRLTASPPARYADMLLDIVSLPVHTTPKLISLGVAQGKRTLKTRIKNMKYISQGKTFTIRLLALLALAALTISLVPIRLTAARPEPGPSPASAPEQVLHQPEPSPASPPSEPTPTETATAENSPAEPELPARNASPSDRLVSLTQGSSSAAWLHELRAMPRAQLRQILPTIIPDRPLITYLEDLAKAEQQLAAISNDYSAEHPRVRGVIAVLETINRQIEDRIDGILAGLQLRSFEPTNARSVKLDLEGESARPARASETIGSQTELPQSSTPVYARTSGIVQAVRVKRGEPIGAGQILIELDDSEAAARLRTFAARFKVAENERRIALTDLGEARKEHQRKQQETQADKDPVSDLPNLAKAEAVLARAEALMEVAHAEWEQAKIEFARCSIAAPHDGIVTSIIGPGEWIPGPGHLLAIVRRDDTQDKLRGQSLQALEEQLVILRTRELELLKEFTPNHPYLIPVTREIAAIDQVIREKKRSQETIQTLEAKLAVLRAREAELLKRYSPKWPEVVQVTREIAELESRLRDLKRRTQNAPNPPGRSGTGSTPNSSNMATISDLMRDPQFRTVIRALQENHQPSPGSKPLAR